METNQQTPKLIRGLLTVLIYVLVLGSGLMIVFLIASKKARKNPISFLKRSVLIATLGMTAFIGFSYWYGKSSFG